MKRSIESIKLANVRKYAPATQAVESGADVSPGATTVDAKTIACAREWKVRSLGDALRERDALLELMISAYRRHMMRVAQYRLYASIDDAEDIVQEASVQAWEQRAELGTAADDAGIKNWIFTCLHRAAGRAKYRSVKARCNVEISEATADTNPARAIPSYSSEPHEILGKYTGLLSERHMKVLALKAGGLRNSQIALELGYKQSGYSMDLVARYLREGRAKLKPLMIELIPEDDARILFNFCARRSI